jgi:hypothetical protein
MKRHRIRKLQQRRGLVEGRFIVGIDPAKLNRLRFALDFSL